LEDPRTLARHLEASLLSASIETIYLTDMGTALGVHGGPGTLIIGVNRLGAAG
jgi:fatty acid-binding protein DegV